MLTRIGFRQGDCAVIALCIPVYFAALYISYEFMSAALWPFFAMIGPVALLLGYISRSWSAMLAPLVAWLLLTVLWALMIGNVSDLNPTEALVRVHEDYRWLAWPVLASGFLIGRSLRIAMHVIRHGLGKNVVRGA